MVRLLGADERHCSKCGRLITDAEWERLLPIGFQVIPAFKDEPGEVLEMRNDICGSTLAKMMAFEPEDLEEGAMVELEAMGSEQNVQPGSLRRAQSIAADNLRKDRRYYKR